MGVNVVEFTREDYLSCDFRGAVHRYLGCSMQFYYCLHDLCKFHFVGHTLFSPRAFSSSFCFHLHFSVQVLLLSKLSICAKNGNPYCL